MSQLVIDHVDPLPLRIVLAATFPVLRMHEVDRAVFVGLACGLPPVEIFVPFDTRVLEPVELTQQRQRPPELQGSVAVKEAGEVLINRPPLPYWG